MRIKLLALALGASMALSSCATHTSPTGRGQMLLFSEAQMNQMGEQSFEQIKKQEKVSTDPKATAYVNCIANAIIKELPTQQQWETVTFDSEQLNAFALPGGHIGVYTGLMKAATNQHQLAAVIGHEIGHVLARHGNEQVSRGQLSSAGLQIANIALQGQTPVEREMAMTALGAGLQLGLMLPFSRAQETESDEIGAELMARAGFNPAEAITLWENMGKLSGGAPPELLSTHPSSSTRIQDLRNLQAKVQPIYESARAAGKRPNCKI
ncbi:M48 family metallopeptidase [Paraferrimonas sedimenticola]|uniref:Zn-dependent protease n=1 Tax=Paraferrimonas sedimenticola TaxID=375674 RepID=A0AA37RXT8_9GAMM|nr:M48 family metallopeptidase [Paraferrimonas sedimenticola]GLP97088.1 Zn-dependent protease [Paraferrimonas sedimenticola]